jgi:hypothetical protein
MTTSDGGPILELLAKLDEMYGPLTDEELAEGEREWKAMLERLHTSLQLSSDSPGGIERQQKPI